MSNKETLQNYNTRLSSNNDSLDALINVINSLPNASVDPVLQDKSIEITENGSQMVMADEGYDALNSVEITTKIPTGGSEVSPDYVTDGLIAWFDENEPMDETEKWYNKVGDDYIYVLSRRYGNETTNPYMKTSKNQPLINRADYTFVSSVDYYKTGYTIEIVGLINGMNSDSASGGWLLTGDMGASAGVGAMVTPDTSRSTILRFINTNTDADNQEAFRINYGENFGASVFFENILNRTDTSYTKYKVQASVHGCDWLTVNQTSNYNHGSKAERLVILGYYGTGSMYRAVGSIRCIRIYNRQLTNEEMKGNHAIDVARFNLEK